MDTSIHSGTAEEEGKSKFRSTLLLQTTPTNTYSSLRYILYKRIDIMSKQLQFWVVVVLS